MYVYNMPVCFNLYTCVVVVYVCVYHTGFFNETVDDFSTSIDAGFSSRTLNLNQGFVNFTDLVCTIFYFTAGHIVQVIPIIVHQFTW